MSLPRCLVPGATYLVTRRCIGRQFLLRPSKLVNQLFLFCLAVGAQRFGIDLHAVCVMSNHYHLVVTDPLARLPAFIGWLDATLARALNAMRGRWDTVWSGGSYNAVRLEDEGAIVKACAYTLANPVSAGLVREGHLWPGLRLGPESFGRSIDARRPHHFFRQNGPLPASATLVMKSSTEEQSGAFAARVCQLTLDLEESARQKVAAENRRFLGRRAALAQLPTESPTSRERHRKLRPTVSCSDRQHRLEALKRLREFRVAYREARERYVAGERHALFPAGTYALRIRFGVRCAPA